MTDTPISVASHTHGTNADLPVAPTPFYLPLLSVCQSNKWETWNGFTVPSTCTSIEEEYDAAHFGLGLVDISPTARYRIKGEEATVYVNRLLTADVSNQDVGENIKSPMCNMRGGVIDVITALKMAEDEFWLVGECPHIAWLIDSAMGFDVSVDDMVPSTAGLLLIGPQSEALLENVGAAEISRLDAGRSQIAKVAEVSVRFVRREGLLQPAYEMWMRAEDAQTVWSHLLHVKGGLRPHPLGQKVVDRIRVENGQLRCGVDFHPASRFQNPDHLRTPFEIAMGDLISFNKGHFNGREALIRSNPRMALVGIDFGRQGVEPGEPLSKPGGSEKMGKILSSTWSPRLHAAIALAEVVIGSDAPGNQLEAHTVEANGPDRNRKKVSGTVTNLPFL